MRDKLKSILVSIAVTLILLLVIEGVSKLILHNIYNRSFPESIIQQAKYASSAGLKPNQQAVVWGQQFTTDSFGCRKSRVPYASGKKKWLFIGDSVTEGVGVDDSSTFVSLFADELTDYNVLNYSLIGYSVTDYKNVLQTLLQCDTTIELVTLVWCLNDVYGALPKSKLPAIAQQNLKGKVNEFLQQNYATYKLLKLLFYGRRDTYYRYDRQFYNSSYIMQPAFETLKSCDSLCKTAGVFMQVVSLPYQSQLVSGDNLPQQQLQRYCVQNDIAFSDALEFLKKQPQANYYLFADEIHLSATGHRAIAAFLKE